MRMFYCLLFSLLAASHTDTSVRPIPVHPADTAPSIGPLTTQQTSEDSVYKFGDYLFVGDRNLVCDFYPSGNPPLQLKSKGDTLYTDSDYTILVNDKKGIGPIYKKYNPKYRFGDYKVSSLYQGPLATPNLRTDPPSRYYRTMIRQACEDSTPNFAGHCTIAEWGCGSACGMMALVDRANGRVFFSGKYLPFDSMDGHWGVDFRKDSRLLIVNSYLLYDYPGYMLQEDWRQLSFYEWNGSSFSQLQ